MGTIPDGFAIDIGQKQWYIVEAELGHHDVWNHIAKQVSKKIVASLQLTTKQKLGFERHILISKLKNISESLRYAAEAVREGGLPLLNAS